MKRKNFFVPWQKRRTILFVRNPKRKRNCRRTDSCCVFGSSFQLLQQYFVFLFGVIFHILIYYAYISIKSSVPRTSHSPYFSKSSFDNVVGLSEMNWRFRSIISSLQTESWNFRSMSSQWFRRSVRRIRRSVRNELKVSFAYFFTPNRILKFSFDVLVVCLVIPKWTFVRSLCSKIDHQS